MSIFDKTRLVTEVEFHGFNIQKWEPYSMWHVERPSGLSHMPVTLRLPKHTLKEAQKAILDFIEEINKKKKGRLA